MFSTKKGAARLTLGVIIGLVILKIVVSVITGSISIIAQTADSSLDLLAVVIAFFAISMAAKPADEEHPFGHGKIENISAIVQAILIFTAGGLIIYSAANRILSKATIEMTEAGIGIMVVSIVVSILLSRYLLKVSKATDSLALEAIGHNIAADVYSAAGVLAGLVAIRLTGLIILDPIVALLVAILIIRTAYLTFRKSFAGLMDTRLPEAEENTIKSIINKYSDQLVGFHELRTRKAGSQRFIELHLVMSSNISLEEAHNVCDGIEQDIEAELPHSSVNIHVEPESKGD